VGVLAGVSEEALAATVIGTAVNQSKITYTADEQHYTD
jgi:hypothetical protein